MVAVAADHAVGHEKGVPQGLGGGLDCGGEYGRHLAVGKHGCGQGFCFIVN